MKEDQPRKTDSPEPAQGQQPRDLHRYETSLGKILRSLAIVLVGGVVLVLVLRYVAGINF
jgi:hypothetical protein